MSGLDLGRKGKEWVGFDFGVVFVCLGAESLVV
jgi:hypothetical protein